MQAIRVERQIGGKTLAIETGTYAKLADGSVTVQYGESVVLGAVVRANPREGIDFFPLQVDYRERRAAAGKFPGGFMKREGRPTNKEILTAGLIEELQSKSPKEKAGDTKLPDPGFVDAIRARVADKIREVKGKPGKHDRSDAVKKLLDDLIAEMAPPVTDPNASYAAIISQKDHAKRIRSVFADVEEQATREAILSGVRPDGRGFKDIRPISSAVGILPRVHGSAVFSRGETQAMCTITLGTSSDEQMVDGLIEEYSQKFMLHYNFPSYSVGEVRPIRGPGRREIGHGALAERSLVAVLPAVDQFPYTVRIISDILESNGSSSMASSCGGCLALMDAGVPISKPVAGISIGLVQEGDKYELLTDIIGEEDHFGDMDFKVCGTRDGITAIQLDIKTEGITHKIIRDTLHQAHDARLVILQKMAEVLAAPRPEISKYAPRLLTIHINPEKIGKLIGPGGKNIKKIQEETGCNIDIEDDGTVFISSVDAAAAEQCRNIVEAMMAEVKVGRIYNGRVVSIKEFGAFVEIAPETDGLCHVSELSNRYINRVTDIVNVGDDVKVKVILIDDTGRIKLSRKQAMRELGESDPEPQGQGDEGDEGEGGPIVDDEGPDAIGERPQGEFRPREGGGYGGGGGRGGD